MKRKYPAYLFWMGFVGNIFGRFFYLFFPAVILLFIGIWKKGCLTAGACLLTADIALSLIAQLIIRQTVLKESGNPNFREFQEAVLSPNWQENLAEFRERHYVDHEKAPEESEEQ